MGWSRSPHCSTSMYSIYWTTPLGRCRHSPLSNMGRWTPPIGRCWPSINIDPGKQLNPTKLCMLAQAVSSTFDSLTVYSFLPPVVSIFPVAPFLPFPSRVVPSRPVLFVFGVDVALVRWLPVSGGSAYLVRCGLSISQSSIGALSFLAKQRRISS